MNDTKSKYILHEFRMGDVEDPEIYCAEPIYQWQQTPEGKWCMEHAEDIHWISAVEPKFFGHEIKIIGTLSGKHATFWALKKS